MVPISLPSSFEQRVLSREAPGGPPTALLLTAPTITTPGEPFDLRLALADAKGYPSLPAAEEEVTVRGDFASPGDVTVRFAAGRPAVAVLRGLAIRSEGTFRFQAEALGATFWSNPTRCLARPAARIYWGDPHVHTVLSNCHPDRCRSVNFCYVAARHFAGLDWVSAADHVSNRRCELARWKEQAAAGDAFNDPPAFVTLPAYEASFRGGCGGDNNVYMLRWPDLFVEDYEQGSVRTMCDKLAAKLRPGEEFFVVPHHTTRTNKHGEIGDDIYPGEEIMPLLEIHSKWGTSEYRGNPNPLLKVHPGPSYAVDLLNGGLRMGFIGGTDTHSTMPAGFGDEQLDRLPGMTAVAAADLSRESIYQGLRRRRCYAASLERIYLDFTVCGVGQGQTLARSELRGPRRVVAEAAAGSSIVSIDLVRNGRTVHSAPIGNWRGELRLEDDDPLDSILMDSRHLGRFAYYYLRVTCASGAQGWSSPVWVA